VYIFSANVRPFTRKSHLSTSHIIQIQRPTVVATALDKHQKTHIYYHNSSYSTRAQCSTIQDNNGHQFAIILSYLYKICCSKCSTAKLLFTVRKKQKNKSSNFIQVVNNNKIAQSNLETGCNLTPGGRHCWPPCTIIQLYFPGDTNVHTHPTHYSK